MKTMRRPNQPKSQAQMYRRTNLLTTLIKTTQFLKFFSSTPSRPQLFNSPPSLNTCIATLQTCAATTNLSKGQQLHALMLTTNLLPTSPLYITGLINMYSKCHLISHALSVFHSFPVLSHNVYAHNAVISGFVLNDLLEPAFEFYLRMKESGLSPDEFAFPCVIKASSESSDGGSLVRMIHGELFKYGLESNLFVGSALVHCYLKFGMVGNAREVFDELPDRDVVLWNAMINGYTRIGEMGKALGIFKRMRNEGCVLSGFTVTGTLSIFAVTGDLESGMGMHVLVLKMGFCSSIAVCNALIDMYGKCKCVGMALDVFEGMDVKDMFSWNSIIGVHEQCGYHEGSLSLFYDMLLNGVQPDLVTVTTVLPACAHLAALKHGREIHGYMITNGLGRDSGDEDSDRYKNNVVMDMYAKCGSMREALLAFDNAGFKDVASWNIMIMGYGTQGFGSKALDVFSGMNQAHLKPTQGFGSKALDVFSGMNQAHLKPNDITFIGVLSACSHASLVRQGKESLRQMEQEYGVVPSIEHYTCVIDMLGRAGLLEEAYGLLSILPIHSNPVVWRALLAACRIHGNANLAEVAAQRVIDLEPEHCGSYVLISNVYGAAGRYHEVSDVRDTMKEQNVKKTLLGCSWVELGNTVHLPPEIGDIKKRA